MNVKGFVKCFFSRHCIIDPNESIVSKTMTDERNFLCKCHRCGLYVIHDGAISGLTSRFMSEREAFRITRELESTFRTIKKQERRETGKWVKIEVSGDYIDRKALLKQIEGRYGDEWQFVDIIKNAPSVVPMKESDEEWNNAQNVEDI